MIAINDWVYRIEPMVFTRLKNDFSNAIKSKYDMKTANFTTDETSSKNPVFPNVVVRLLDPMETGKDLEQLEIHGGIFTFQVDITDNKSKARAKEVAIEVNNLMKKMRFEAVLIPFPSAQDGLYRCVGRYRRNIDKNDIL